ncbi:hypothetical protein BRADI_2g04844v3 [Brachypodium distachyon]|uniref:Uncharacterized protein n=1 Tax=Brachypodium distachyon TaxID=15368 RepID=A0A2K2D719_BRADI|nr:hypothetical protein BRADI_2g04844v3 [Brachypodium distachyon]
MRYYLTCLGICTYMPGGKEGGGEWSRDQQAGYFWGIAIEKVSWTGWEENKSQGDFFLRLIQHGDYRRNTAKCKHKKTG